MVVMDNSKKENTVGSWAGTIIYLEKRRIGWSA
jgi:hypothetical protein